MELKTLRAAGTTELNSWQHLRITDTFQRYGMWRGKPVSMDDPDSVGLSLWCCEVLGLSIHVTPLSPSCTTTPVLQSMVRVWHRAVAPSALVVGTEPRRLKMLLGQCCQREGLKILYVAYLFILAGVVYYYFQTSVEKTAPEIAGESSQSTGRTLRPVWGMMMDKCYPETTQRREVKSRKQQASGAISPRATGRQNDSAPKDLTDMLPQEEEQEKKKVQEEVAEYPSGASVIDSKEERLSGWAPQLLRKFWQDWFPAPDTPKVQSHE